MLVHHEEAATNHHYKLMIYSALLFLCFFSIIFHGHHYLLGDYLGGQDQTAIIDGLINLEQTNNLFEARQNWLTFGNYPPGVLMLFYSATSLTGLDFFTLNPIFLYIYDFVLPLFAYIVTHTILRKMNIPKAGWYALIAALLIAFSGMGMVPDMGSTAAQTIIAPAFILLLFSLENISKKKKTYLGLIFFLSLTIFLTHRLTSIFVVILALVYLFLNLYRTPLKNIKEKLLASSIILILFPSSHIMCPIGDSWSFLIFKELIPIVALLGLMVLSLRFLFKAKPFLKRFTTTYLYPIIPLLILVYFFTSILFGCITSSSTIIYSGLKVGIFSMLLASIALIYMASRKRFGLIPSMFMLSIFAFSILVLNPHIMPSFIPSLHYNRLTWFIILFSSIISAIGVYFISMSKERQKNIFGKTIYIKSIAIILLLAWISYAVGECGTTLYYGIQKIPLLSIKFLKNPIIFGILIIPIIVLLFILALKKIKRPVFFSLLCVLSFSLAIVPFVYSTEMLFDYNEDGFMNSIKWADINSDNNTIFVSDLWSSDYIGSLTQKPCFPSPRSSFGPNPGALSYYSAIYFLDKIGNAKIGNNDAHVSKYILHKFAPDKEELVLIINKQPPGLGYYAKKGIPLYISHIYTNNVSLEKPSADPDLILVYNDQYTSIYIDKTY